VGTSPPFPSPSTPQDDRTLALKRRKAWLRSALICYAAAALFWFGGAKGEIISLLTQALGTLALAVHAWFRRSLSAWILVAIVAGVIFGAWFPSQAEGLQVLGLIFLRLIRAIVAPLIFATLVVGIAGQTDLKQVGRMGLKAIVYFEVVTTLALLIGLGAINLTRAGEGVRLSATAQTEAPSVEKMSGSEILLHAFPENIAKSVAENQVLQVVVFSVLFGIGLARVSGPRREAVLRFTEGLADTMFQFTRVVMYFAPIGVGAAIAYTVGHVGLGILGDFAKLLATLYGALFVFLLGVLLPVALLARVPLKRFIRAIAEPVSIAFGTSSSEAALPRAMEAMEELGVPRRVVAFVMPTGYSFNLDGSSIYLSLAAVFVAQAAGIHLSFGRQFVILLTLMLASKGVAGVSRASLVILMGTASSFGLPSEPIFLLLGIDPLMDMARTAVNVIGNCLATVVVARWEGELA
jgi:proton glutamate symport protein